MRKRMAGIAPARTRMMSVLGLQGNVCAANAAMMPTIKKTQAAAIEVFAILRRISNLMPFGSQRSMD